MKDEITKIVKVLAVFLGSGIGLIILIIAIAALAPLSMFWILSVSTPGSAVRMKMWIKVVDQNGNPVSGYTIRLSGIRPSYFIPPPFADIKGFSGQVTTDAKGMAFFDSKKKLVLLDIGMWDDDIKGNYGYLGHREHFEKVRMSSSFYRGKLASEEEKRCQAFKGFRPNDKEHPIIYEVFKCPTPDKDIEVKWETWKKDAIKEKTYVSFDAVEGLLWYSDQPEGDISFRKILEEEYKKKYWNDPRSLPNGFEIIANKDAGIQIAKDCYWVEAPSEGYRDKLVYYYDFRNDDAPTRHDARGIECIFYYKPILYYYCRNKKIYGVLDIYGCVVPSPNEIHCLRYKINKKGSRSLYSGKWDNFL